MSTLDYEFRRYNNIENLKVDSTNQGDDCHASTTKFKSKTIFSDI